MPEVNFLGEDEISGSNLFNFELITQREVLPAMSTAETDITKAQSLKRRRLEAAPAKHSTILSQNADKHIVRLLTEALQLDETCSSSDFQQRMMQIKEIVREQDSKPPRASRPAAANPIEAGSASYGPCLRDGARIGAPGSSKILLPSQLYPARTPSVASA